MKSNGDLRNSAEAASHAFARTMERKIDLSLKHEMGTDPEQEGRTRLRGAFSIVLQRIRPAPGPYWMIFLTRAPSDLRGSESGTGLL